jgi:hypothetical protein
MEEEKEKEEREREKKNRRKIYYFKIFGMGGEKNSFKQNLDMVISVSFFH